MAKSINPNPFFRRPFANPQGRSYFPEPIEPAQPAQPAAVLLPEQQSVTELLCAPHHRLEISHDLLQRNGLGGHLLGRH